MSDLPLTGSRKRCHHEPRRCEVCSEIKCARCNEELYVTKDKPLLWTCLKCQVTTDINATLKQRYSGKPGNDKPHLVIEGQVIPIARMTTETKVDHCEMEWGGGHTKYVAGPDRMRVLLELHVLHLGGPFHDLMHKTLIIINIDTKPIHIIVTEVTSEFHSNSGHVITIEGRQAE